MLKELRTTTTPRPKTPNKFYHQKNISNYFSTISNNAPTKNSSRENTLITSCDLLSNLERTSRTNLSNKFSNSEKLKRGKKIIKQSSKIINKKIINNKMNSYKNNNVNNNNDENLINNNKFNNNYFSNEKNKRSKTPNYKTNNNNNEINNYNKLNNSKIKHIRNENTKSFFESIQRNEPIKYDKSYYNTVDHDMSNLEGMINSIKLRGFNKYQNEIEEKLEKKGKLENSISLLKSKLNLYENQKKNCKQEDAKNLIQIQNMKNVNQRYKNINDGIEKYQKEIPIYKPQIEKLKNETIQINTQIIEFKREIDMMKNQIQKLNKMISDKKKEKDNFRPALKLLKNHIANLKQKIKSFDIGKTDFMINLSHFAEKGVNY